MFRLKLLPISQQKSLKLNLLFQSGNNKTPLKEKQKKMSSDNVKHALLQKWGAIH
jgi:hypothetical protein